MNSSARPLTIKLPTMSNFTPKWIHRVNGKNGKWIFVPSEHSRVYGKFVVKRVRLEWLPPKYFYHLRGGGHLSAIDAHLKNKYFSRLDIENFFGSITASRITRVLKPYLGYELSREIAKQSTVRVPGSTKKELMLPFGFVQSAILASICLDKSSLGIFLNKVKNDKTISLSVYMDDILISSNNKQKLVEVTEEIKKSICRSSWLSNIKKEVIASESITAFNIDVAQNKRYVNQEKLKQLEFDFYQAESVAKKNGISSYVKKVNHEQAYIFI